MIRPWAILPVKEMAGAKQRLAALLSPEERIALMRVMVEDVVAALCGASGLAGIALVTLDPWASELAARHRLPRLHPPRSRAARRRWLPGWS